MLWVACDGIVAIVTRVAAAILVMMACIRQDVATFGILATSSTAATLVPDLPRPRPCTIMVVKATLMT